ncbi:MAG: hypothetical protein ABL997_07560 [Planctomycetota bacterium]
MSIDRGKIKGDTSAIVMDVGVLSARANRALQSTGRVTERSETELVGTVESVDLASRRLTLLSAGQTFDVHVPYDVPITRNGAEVGFDQVSPTKTVTLSFGHIVADRKLVRVELQ